MNAARRVARKRLVLNHTLKMYRTHLGANKPMYEKWKAQLLELLPKLDAKEITKRAYALGLFKRQHTAKRRVSRRKVRRLSFV